MDAASADLVVYLSPQTAKMLAEGLTKAVAAYEFASGGQIRTTFNPGTEEGAAAYFEGMGAVVIRKAGDAGESPLPGH